MAPAPQRDPHWARLFEEFRALEETRSWQKAQGQNDFSLLGSVLSVNDEVRLHTRFLFAMLNPGGKHYQGRRFLELFLQIIGEEGWFKPYSESLVVRKEYCPVDNEDQIDLYLSDGTRTIVIENKLNASDQPGQIKRYLRAIKADSEDNPENTLVIYLTKGRSRPSSTALAYPKSKANGVESDPEPLTVFEHNGELALGVNVGKPWARYRSLTYRSGHAVHVWLDACEEVVKHSAPADNIVWAIREYRNVIKRATKEYRTNVESLKKHMEEKDYAGGDFHRDAIKMTAELRKAHEGWLHEAMTDQLTEGLFRAAIEAGTLEPISRLNAELLEPFLSDAWADNPQELIYRSNRNFFKSGRKLKQGTFFLVKDGLRLGGQTLLLLLYGKQDLHVGCAFLPGTQEVGKAKLTQSNVGLKDQTLESIFKAAYTQSQPLEHSGILSLSNFSKSSERKLLCQLMDSFVPESNKEAYNGL